MSSSPFEVSPISTQDQRTELATFLGMTGLFVLAEELILAQMGEAGLILHGFGALILFILIARTDGDISLLYQALVLVPILRIFNLGVPTFTSNSLIVLTVLYAFLLLSVWLIIRSQNLTTDALGLTRDNLKLVLPGIGIGAILGLIQFGLSLEGLSYEFTIENFVLVIVTLGFLVGLVEETIFRGLIQRLAVELFDTRLAIITISILFGFMHSVWLAPLDIVFAFVVSLFLGWAYVRLNNLWFITSVHGAINIVGFMIAPLYIPAFEGQLEQYLPVLVFGLP